MRNQAETAFAQGENCVIVATSVLELGIDVGDLDFVSQFDAPGSVASFLQRMGRTGRRAGTTPNCTFLCTEDLKLVRAAAIVDLHRKGFVERVEPKESAAHVYAHQVMALALQCSGLARGDLDAWIGDAKPFVALDLNDRREIVDHMLASEILSETDGLLWIGPRGERLYGRRHFSALCAVFEAPRLIVVSHDRNEIGQIDASFLQITLLTVKAPAGYWITSRQLPSLEAERF